MYSDKMDDIVKKVVDPRFAKDEEYRRALLKIEAEGKCPFCPDNFKYHKEPILFERDGWLITKASWPYTNHQYHFLIIAKEHKEHISQLSPSDLVAVNDLANWAIKEFKLKGGALALRFGDSEYTGATVCHLHFHFIVPQFGKVVNFPIG